MDDILIANKGDRDDLTRKGIQTLDKLEKKELFVRASKSVFFVTEIDFLGFWLSKGKLSMEQQKVLGIADWPPPETVTQVKSFLGFCNYYRRFIAHYAELRIPLNDLTRKTIPWNWTSKHQEAFKKLKATFLTYPILLIPNYTKPFIIE